MASEAREPAARSPLPASKAPDSATRITLPVCRAKLRTPDAIPE
jgi:hypothetical protein